MSDILKIFLMLFLQVAFCVKFDLFTFLVTFAWSGLSLVIKIYIESDVRKLEAEKESSTETNEC